jgi:KUP system potassium uptake protein
LIRDPGTLANPFYHLAPAWALYPMVVLATAATIIASQAVISGAFSLTRQAVQLGYLPRLEIRHTSEQEIGQVYLPRVNWLLMAGVIAVVVGFGSSSDLAGAYGIAVVGAMMIDGALAFAVALLLWRWRPWVAALVFCSFLVVDLAFLGASTTKILEGGWFPILLATAVLLVMSTWRKGRAVLFDRLYAGSPALPSFLTGLTRHPVPRVTGTAVYLTNNVDVVPRALLHNLKHNKVLHERIVILRVVTEDVPRVPGRERVEVEHLGANFHRVRVRCGFMESCDVAAITMSCQLGPPEPRVMDTSFFLSRETLVPSGRPDLSPWREQLFIHLTNSALDATRFFKLPPDRVVEVGSRVEI